MYEMYDAYSSNSEPEDVVIINYVNDEGSFDGTVELPCKRKTEIFVLTFRRDTIFDSSCNVIDQSGAVENDYFQFTRKQTDLIFYSCLIPRQECRRERAY